MGRETIRHMVAFTLHSPAGSAEAERFLSDGRKILSAIPVVNRFEVLRQISPKSDYDFGFSMEFDSQADYDAYNAHPDHEAFVEQRWKKEVSRFQELDFTFL